MVGVETPIGVREGKGEGEGEAEIGIAEAVGEGGGSGDSNSAGRVEAIAGSEIASTRAGALQCSAKSAIAPISPKQSVPKPTKISFCLRVIAVQHITERPARQIRPGRFYETLTFGQ